MILIIDDSEFRRDSLVVRLRTKGYLTCGISYEYADSYTKPFMTVYVNPPHNQIGKLKNEDTISVVFSDRKLIETPSWLRVYPYLNNIENEIERIYSENFKYMKKDNIDVIGYVCRKNDEFAIGGKELYLSDMQANVLSIFIYNPDKKFKLYEASSYMHFSGNPEERFLRIVYEINKKSKDENRGKIILFENDNYFLNPDIKNYICIEETDIVTEDKKRPTYLIIDMSYDL